MILMVFVMEQQQMVVQQEGLQLPVVVVNVHLDAMGDNSHRTRQLQALRAQHSHAHCLAAVRAGRDGLVDRVWCAGR